MQLGPEQRLRVETAIDIQRARRLVSTFASRSGLHRPQIDEIVLATSELADNLVKHTLFGGWLSCRIRESPEGDILEVEVADTGPGITDLARALEDGFSTADSIGSGLAVARRQVDFFEMDSSPEGTKVRIGKLVPRQ